MHADELAIDAALVRRLHLAVRLARCEGPKV
jgi:hypothetical protein